MIEGGTPRPAGSFAGGGKQIVTLSRPVPKGATVAITLERSPDATDADARRSSSRRPVSA